MIKLKKGQRFTSEMEPELGLGTLVTSDARTLTINFAASNCIRQYTASAAPLRRVRFDVGDTILFHENSTMVVEKVMKKTGLLVYHGGGLAVAEQELSDEMSLSSPKDRLGAGMVDPADMFDLRFEANRLRHDHETSEAMGFTGGRVDLIAHQFYIAGEVASRHFQEFSLQMKQVLEKPLRHVLFFTGFF